MSEPAPDSPALNLPSLLEAQRAFFRSGAATIEVRLRCLAALENEITRREDDILAALETDLGKPGVEAYIPEIWFIRKEIQLIRRKLKSWARPKRVGTPFFAWPARSEIRREPFGCVLVVAPWNYPVQLSLAPLISAIAAGNTVMLKPSELAPASSRLLSELVAAAFPPSHATVVEGDAEIAQALLGLDFDFWFYTGSENIGKLYAKAAAERLVPCVLELGGKCPAVIDRDIDIEKTVDRILFAKFANAGQICIAVDFVLVPRERCDEFLRIAEQKLRAWYDHDKPDLARIVNRKHYERILAMIPEDALRIGRDDSDALRLAPTLIPNADWDSPAMQEEIFGPVLPVIAYDDLGPELERLRERPSPLALYVFSRDRGFQERVASEVPSGTICFNDAVKQATNLEMPFGGVGTSGMGRYRGKFGFETFTYARAMTRRWFAKDFFTIAPPFGDRLTLLRKLMK